jgi:hypothetical protein
MSKSTTLAQGHINLSDEITITLVEPDNEPALVTDQPPTDRHRVATPQLGHGPPQVQRRSRSSHEDPCGCVHRTGPNQSGQVPLGTTEESLRRSSGGFLVGACPGRRRSDLQPRKVGLPAFAAEPMHKQALTPTPGQTAKQTKEELQNFVYLST